MGFAEILQALAALRRQCDELDDVTRRYLLRVTSPAELPKPSINEWVSPEQVGVERLEFETLPSSRKLTHRLVRFPAKFHAPIARQLILDFTEPGDTLADSFCGSGTLMVEAAVAGRNAIGFDVDPFSVFVAHTKCQRVNVKEFSEASEVLLAKLGDLERPSAEYERFMHEDLSQAEMMAELGDLSAPAIPNLDHWFRNYVIVDLARMRSAIQSAEGPRPTKNLFSTVFLSIIRLASNADPTPVSGLERTSHIRERDEKGRVINPFDLFRRRLVRAVGDLEEYAEARDGRSRCRAALGDATQPMKLRPDESIDAVITSPPYHGAVDYYRRHQLEMFWGGFTDSQGDRLELLDRYLGRPNVPQSHRFVMNTDLAMWPKATASERVIREFSPHRANGFRHYCVGMARTFAELGKVLQPGAPAVFVVGHSQWNGTELETSSLFEELSGPKFELDQQLWYPVKNRHMSYSRRNGANIDREFVLVFRRTKK